MADTLKFTKLHGLGNDFVLIDARSSDVRLGSQMIREIADRKTGVGFDQLLVLKDSPRVHAVLDIYNADASLAEMCGNGLRAAALYLWTRGRVSDQKLVFQTAAGDRSAMALGPVAEDPLIECEMGVPKIKAVPVTIKQHRLICVNVGNPHAVSFKYPKSTAQLTEWGSMIETHKAFPKRTNVEFVRVKDKHVIEVRVWERGVGITEACGTGAVAAAVAAISQGRAASPVEVRFPGGEAEVRWDAASRSPAYLRGHAHEVYSGEFNYRR